MRRLLIASLLVLVSYAHAERSYVIKKDGVSLHIIEFEKDENVSFQVIDAEKSKHYVSDHYSPDRHVFVVNGGYFDGNLKPIGQCRIDGEDISSGKGSSLSGFLTTNNEGQLNLYWKEVPEGEHRDILQSGPFVIDPGGKVGIYTRTGKEAKRAVVAMTSSEKVLIITTSEVYLYDLARILKTELPTIDRALNLDGGPSVGLMYGEVKMVNPNPVRNFLMKRREAK